MKKVCFGDCLLILAVMILGLAEIMHFCAVFLGWSVSRCSVLFAVGGAVLVVGTVLALVWLRFRRAKQEPGKDSGADNRTIRTQREMEREMLRSLPVYAVFGLLLVSQIVFICSGAGIFRNGDMTVETVGSFLVHDGVYKVNPLTGSPYVTGIPLRLEILGLPTLYSMICHLTGMEPAFLVHVIVPVCVLFLSYVAFWVWGRTFFGKKSMERAVFLVFVALIIWVGTYMYGVDGFNLLCSGWRGVTIRNLVLMPWLFSLCMRRQYLCALLCMAAEICLVWTLYGLGACLVVAVGMWLVTFFFGRGQDTMNPEPGREEAV